MFPDQQRLHHLKKIGIIGGGFAGTMTAVQIIEKSHTPCEIILISDAAGLNRGIAYNPYSPKQVLNVIAGKMSAYPDKPDHFTDWVMQQPKFRDKDRSIISNSFLSRQLYGTYLTGIWQESLGLAESKKIVITLVDGWAVDLDIAGNTVRITTDNGRTITVDCCVLATGNNVPGNPKIANPDFFQSRNYFQNPWVLEAVQVAPDALPVLLIGNGLTMVDTVMGLLENGFRGAIYSISPNGFNILQHRHNGLKYSKLTEELKDNTGLFELFRLVHRHIKLVREFGVSAEPVIDSLRPYTQEIWKNLPDGERALFMSRFRYLWGVARHRIPLHIHDKIQQLRIEGRLQIKSGRITDIAESDGKIIVSSFDRKIKRVNQLTVSRVINCSGPETDLMKTGKSLLQTCLQKELLKQDKLKLGISADTQSFQVLSASGEIHPTLFTLGANLKGELWESIAVNELRSQAERLAGKLLEIHIQ
jgi:uncharacterized NAD(P)/FAD-binding protein YdhS